MVHQNEYIGLTVYQQSLDKHEFKIKTVAFDKFQFDKLYNFKIRCNIIMLLSI